MGGARGPGMDAPSYAGDVSSRAAWELLKDNPAAQLLDVRTNAEWNYVGVPDLAGIGRSALFCEWQRFPSGERNGGFAAEAAAALAQAGYAKGAPLLLICRSGARSRAAAIVLTEAGYGPCFNVSDGFEGALDQSRHRGEAEGWKAEGLPWIQF